MNQRALAEEACLAIATVSNFLTGKPVDRATFVELCQRLSLNPEDIADLNTVEVQEPQREIKEASTLTSNPHPSIPMTDWGEALDVSLF